MDNFEFNLLPSPMSSLDVENICQCAIEANNANGEFYYLIVRSKLGVTTIFQFGPLVPDVYFLPNGYSSSIIRLDSDEDKVYKIIDKWLNNRYSKLQEARIIDIDEAEEQFRDLGDYMSRYGQDGVF